MSTRYSSEQLRSIAINANSLLANPGYADNTMRMQVLTCLALFCQATGMTQQQAREYIRNLANAT